MWSSLNGCNDGGSRSAQGEINGPKSFHAVNLFGGRNFFKSRKRVNQRENRMVEMKAEIDLRSQTIPWIELAQTKLRIRSAESGRGCEDLWSEQDVG